jgi:AcrR family transcriptional regulator
MAVSRQARVPQASVPESAVAVGPRARMKRMLLDTAMDLMQQGRIPSVSDVAEAAAVSRATAYRYFPSQASMIQDAVQEALGPILAFAPGSEKPEERVRDLLAFAFPRIEAYEATHRATILLSLYQWTQRKAGTLAEAQIVRGHRRKLLANAVSPLRAQLGRAAFDKLTQALSLIFGTEALIVLKDIWGLDGDEARRVAVWAAIALVRTAAAEAADGREHPAPGMRSRAPNRAPSQEFRRPVATGPKRRNGSGVKTAQKIVLKREKR